MEGTAWNNPYLAAPVASQVALNLHRHRVYVIFPNAAEPTTLRFMRHGGPKFINIAQEDVCGTVDASDKEASNTSAMLRFHARIGWEGDVFQVTNGDSCLSIYVQGLRCYLTPHVSFSLHDGAVLEFGVSNKPQKPLTAIIKYIYESDNIEGARVFPDDKATATNPKERLNIKRKRSFGSINTPTASGTTDKSGKNGLISQTTNPANSPGEVSQDANQDREDVYDMWRGFNNPMHELPGFIEWMANEEQKYLEKHHGENKKAKRTHDMKDNEKRGAGIQGQAGSTSTSAVSEPKELASPPPKRSRTASNNL
ncbi:hypothetical protein RhiLY_08994 [Ceratobasidium sp. AG-Ba]|nr:hypothetical protein RhiLY_08994 [Ceratobasidium sp. AG-Ba]